MKQIPSTFKHRILVIDDNSSIHDDFIKILGCRRSEKNGELTEMESLLFGIKPQLDTSQSYDVDCATQGEEGLALLVKAHAENRPYAMAFVDGRMPPGWDGVETIGHLWKADPELQVVLSTAYADYSWQEIQRELGSTDGLLILKKPFDNVEVLQLAHTLTRKWELNREIQGRLHNLAFFDQLTGLSNRSLFHDRIHQAVSNALRTVTRLALIFIDLDDFKRINDSLGHNFGDQVLITVAQRLEKSLRLGDTIARCSAARLGGDEFTVLISNLEENHQSAVVANRIINAISAPIEVGDHHVIVTPSLGIATFPDDGHDVDTLLMNADLAMYSSKRNSPGSFAFFKESMNVSVMRRLTLEIQLRQAISRNELALAYQPQFSLQTGELVGLEALLRWHCPRLGEISPEEFVHVAEECGFIDVLGLWVLQSACFQVQSWRSLGLKIPRIAVNVSVKQFKCNDFVQSVEAALASSGLPPACLELEVTESLFDKSFGSTAKKLSELRRMSVRVAIDDFGKGYSSLARLRSIPVDSLKIDHMFVKGIGISQGDETVVNAIVTMASGLGLSTVAEGVETQVQLDYLRQHQCDEVQGFLFSKPMLVADLENYMRSLERQDNVLIAFNPR